MKKDQAVMLWAFAQEVAVRYSHTDRQNNFSNESFAVQKVEILSDSTAVVYYKKEPTKKIAAFFFYWTNGNGGNWKYFVPTDSHVIGMVNFKDKLLAVEQHNFPLNFEKPEEPEVEENG